MISRARLKTLEAAASRIASRPHGEPDIEVMLTPEDRRFFEQRDGAPLAQWSSADKERAICILSKYTPPKVYGEHGTGRLLHCACDYCQGYRIYHEHQQSLNGGKATSC